MTLNPGSGPPKGQPTAGVATAGFELIERLLDEHRRTGRIPTLERWLTIYGQRLQQYARDNPSAPAQKDAATVAQALNLASELIESIVTKAARPRGR